MRRSATITFLPAPIRHRGEIFSQFLPAVMEGTWRCANRSMNSPRLSPAATRQQVWSCSKCGPFDKRRPAAPSAQPRGSRLQLRASRSQPSNSSPQPCDDDPQQTLPLPATRAKPPASTRARPETSHPAPARSIPRRATPTPPGKPAPARSTPPQRNAHRRGSVLAALCRAAAAATLPPAPRPGQGRPLHGPTSAFKTQQISPMTITSLLPFPSLPLQRSSSEEFCSENRGG